MPLIVPFDTMWGLYSALLAAYPDHKPCNGGYNNQCAIRMSIILEQSGISLKNYTEPRCKHGHARGAESLANWLWKRHLGRPKIYSDPATGKRKLADAQGLLFFRNCFTRDGQTTRSGDHVDLWKKGEVMTYDDPDNYSQQLWFWAIA